MRRGNLLFVALGWLLCAVPTAAQTPPAHAPLNDDALSALKLLEPVWRSEIVHGESSALLRLEEEGPVTVRLARPAKEVLSIIASNRSFQVDVKTEIKLDESGHVITLLNAPREAIIPQSAFFPPPESPHSYRHRRDHPEQNMLYGPGRWFHDHQVEVTYRSREAWNGPIPRLAAEQLPKTFAKLRNGEPITLGVSGDSISTGLDSSSTGEVDPLQPGYADLFAAQLQASYGSPIRLVNRAVAGWSVANGLEDLETLLAEKPDLLIVAYGMNDVGRRDPDWFAEQTGTLIARAKEKLTEVEIILVSTMLGHAEWVHTPRDMFPLYRDKLEAMTGPGVAHADLTTIWEAMLVHKHDLDLTGNGLNHPNDYGHRLYAQAILALLVE